MLLADTDVPQRRYWTNFLAQEAGLNGRSVLLPAIEPMKAGAMAQGRFEPVKSMPFNGR